MNNIKYILLLLTVVLTACNNVVENTNIPYSRVSFLIDVSPTGADKELREGLMGNCKVYNGKSPAVLSPGIGAYGYSGVVVTRATDDKLYAFDMCCPYEAKKDIVLKADGFFMNCPVCGSQFSIGNGSGYVNKGPAAQPLKTYHVYRSSGDRWSVVN